jgi:TPR repeat protein
LSVDFEQATGWYKRAAARDYLPAIFSLGALYANQRVSPGDDIRGLALLLEAGERAAGNDPKFRVVRENQPELVRRMKAWMTPQQITEAERRVRARPPRRGLRPLGTQDRID